MRETRPSGSEGGGSELNRFFLPLSAVYALSSRVLPQACAVWTQLARSNRATRGSDQLREYRLGSLRSCLR